MYFEIRTYTPYCGEEIIHYIEAETYEKAEQEADIFVAEDAREWCDEECLDDDFDGNYDEYFAECGAEIYEIPYEEFLENMI